MKILINEEIKNRLWKLNEEEFDALEKSILKEGVRDALILWNDILVDGHNRYEICKKHKISAKVVQKEFKDINDVLKWVDNNQLSRRNLEDWQRSLLRARISEANKQEGFKGNQYESGNGKIFHNQKQVAKELGVDVRTLYNDTKFLKAYEDVERTIGKDNVDELARTITKQDMIKIGKLNPFEQEETIKKIKEEGKNIATIIKKSEINQIKKNIEEGKFILPEGKFQVIMMDVPWPYGTDYDSENRRVGNPYPEMTLEEIYNLTIPSDDNCILFFWTTQKFIKESFSLIEHYGFDYKGLIVWDKEKMGIGSTLRMQCEFCMVAFKGKPLWNLNNVRDIIREPRREHSRKPDSIYQIINEGLIGRKLDYFSRENREEWETFGYEKFKNSSIIL